jgi:steroid 5-alpha reductase family enzyme
LFDLFGGSSFVLNAWLVSMLISQTLTLRQWLLVGLVTAYGLRLSGYLFSRILNSHSDSRFDPYFIHEGEAWMTAPKYYPFKLSILWIMQIMWVFVVQLPVSIVLGKAADSNRMAMQWYDWCFIVAAILAFVMEAVADYQKTQSKADPATKDLWTETGLWRYCRHPNYFGEMAGWTFVFCFCAPLLVDAEWVAVLSPVFITLLLMFVSGVPLAEAKYDSKYGSNLDYQHYKQGTNLLIPWFPAVPATATADVYSESSVMNQSKAQ